MTNGQAALYGLDTVDKGMMIHTVGRIEQEGTRFHHATQNGKHFKTYELFISGIFHLIFWIKVDYK